MKNKPSDELLARSRIIRRSVSVNVLIAVIMKCGVIFVCEIYDCAFEETSDFLLILKRTFSERGNVGLGGGGCCYFAFFRR